MGCVLSRANCFIQDFVVSIAVIHHFASPERRREAIKVSKDDAQLPNMTDICIHTGTITNHTSWWQSLSLCMGSWANQVQQTQLWARQTRCICAMDVEIRPIQSVPAILSPIPTRRTRSAFHINLQCHYWNFWLWQGQPLCHRYQGIIDNVYIYSFHHLLYYTQRKYDFFVHDFRKKWMLIQRMLYGKGKKRFFLGGTT